MAEWSFIDSFIRLQSERSRLIGCGYFLIRPINWCSCRRRRPISARGPQKAAPYHVRPFNQTTNYVAPFMCAHRSPVPGRRISSSPRISLSLSASDPNPIRWIQFNQIIKFNPVFSSCVMASHWKRPPPLLTAIYLNNWTLFFYFAMAAAI